MPNFGVNLGRYERPKRPEKYIFRTSSLRPLLWQSLGKSFFFSIFHDFS